MSKEKILISIKSVHIIILFASFPFMLVYVLFGLDAFLKAGLFSPIALATFGYGMAVIFGFLAFKKSSFLGGALAGWVLFGLGNMMDYQDAMQQNSQECAQLRNDPTCVEDAINGFQCSDFQGQGFTSVPSTVCSDK